MATPRSKKLQSITRLRAYIAARQFRQKLGEYYSTREHFPSADEESLIDAVEHFIREYTEVEA